jgi:hypothetical protein
MKRILIGTVAVTGTLALLLQLWIVLQRDAEFGRLFALADYLGYFTILANILVTLAAYAASFGRPSLFRTASAQAAVAVYIFVTMLIYHVVLRPLWDPQGLVLLATTLLHYVIPLSYLCWWVVFADKSSLSWMMPPRWLGVPVAYLIVSLLRGVITGWYPYGFLDVSKLGYASVLRNAAFVALLFLGVGWVLVLVARISLRLRWQGTGQRG